jgi:iron complex outermembrane receptor protein
MNQPVSRTAHSLRILNFTKPRNRSFLLGCAAGLALAVGTLGNLGVAMAGDDVTANGDPIETIVVTGTRFDTEAAPAKASVDTVEPQTVIDRSYIENFVQPQSDYVTILAIVPSMTGGDPNGPGLSDGGEKNSLRGLGDGQYVIQFDGVPFGDTNGPTHHNISYFPASVLGSIVVDRGPGMASNMGPATYGGTVKLFSQTLTADPQVNATVAYGSFETQTAALNGQSGDLDAFGTTTRVLVNLQGTESNGALTEQDLRDWNALLKIETEITPDWKATLFTNYSYLREHLDDNNGLTPAQVLVYGKDFSLQNTDPLVPTYYAYNYTTKSTDMDYFRLNGTIIDGLKLDNIAYTYAYWNHTFSPNSQTQTLSQINANTSADNATLTLLNGTKVPNQILAYDKENRYRVYGDIVKFSQDYDLGWVSGEIRTGAWLEMQHTNRFKFYFDASRCNADLIDPFVAGGGAAASACGATKGSDPVSGLGYAKDDEHSDWHQYQPFFELDIRPLDNLVITPGVKYVHWNHDVDAPVEQGNLCGVDVACPPFNEKGQDFTASYTTRKALPFLTVNYKIDPSWSVYFEYAKGIYVPDISSFETSTTPGNFPTAETTTNYQFGTVFYADNFTFDADLYYIPVSNNIVSQPCTFDINETCSLNNGSATYKGIEAEGTYAFGDVFGLDLQGLSLFASGSVMSSKQSNGLWEPDAPKWTAAAGVIYKRNGWKFSLIDKTTGPEYNDGQNLSFYVLPAWSNVSASVAYAFDNYEVGVNVDNLLNSRAVTVITEGTSGVVQSNPATSNDQYQFQAPISAIVSLKVHFGFHGEEASPVAAYVPPPAVAPTPSVSKSYLVFFDFNKSDLTADATTIVDRAAKNAGPAKVTQLTVTGHTDTVGSDAYNMRLSRRRAESVAAQLEKDGISSSEIEIVAKGKRDLLVPTKDGVKEPQNRRVQIVYDNGATS